MDAQEATDAALAYFRSMGDPIGFVIERAQRDGENWVVVCSMWLHFGASARTHYRLDFADDTGRLVSVAKVDEA